MRPVIQIETRNIPLLKLAYFQEVLAQEMRFKIGMQNSTAKQSFDIVLTMIGKGLFTLLSTEDWKYIIT